MGVNGRVNRAMLAGLSFLTAVAGCASTKPDAPSGQAPVIAAPKKPVFTLADVIGRRTDELDEKFGTPALIRREGPGEFRRYTLAGCALIVITYPSENGERRASHVSASALQSTEASPSPEACLARGLAQP
ncbi:MAG: hypothetical protein AAF850_00195 [Pseudomonadota bacterium]